MKNFLKSVLASMFGFILAWFLVLLFCTLLLLGLVAVATSKIKKGDAVTLNHHSILKIALNQTIAERRAPFSLGDLSGQNKSQPGLMEIVDAIDNAAFDKNIDGIYLHLESLSGGRASVTEIRNALLRFKESKKFILAYAEGYTQNAYLLASAADEVYLNPLGLVEWKGYASQTPFFKGTLEKLEIQPEIIRHGKFKSAVEPFIADHMSDENKAQIKTLIDFLWQDAKSSVSTSREIATADLEGFAENGTLGDADSAVKNGFVNQLLYEDEVMDRLKQKTGTTELEPHFISLAQYAASRPKKKSSDSKIAVIYAVGDISSGEGSEGHIGSKSLTRWIRKAANDDSVKAIVLRINSPGGSALASEVIWREITLAKKQKPVVASLGDVAASGGYYIACAADRIVCQSGTITGSIGVFGLLFNMQGLYQNKLGITFDTYKTSPYADIGTTTRALSDSEREKIQHQIELIYSTFVNRVANGRGLKVEQVDAIGQGRVWSGADGLKLGLVDQTGNFGEAIRLAAELAHLESYDLRIVPGEKKPYQELMDNFSSSFESKWLGNTLLERLGILKTLSDLGKLQGIQARLPFDIDYE
jgi:protease-4